MRSHAEATVSSPPLRRTVPLPENRSTVTACTEGSTDLNSSLRSSHSVDRMGPDIWTLLQTGCAGSDEMFTLLRVVPGLPYSAQARIAAGDRRAPPTGRWYRTARPRRSTPRRESMPLQLSAPQHSTSEGPRPARKVDICCVCTSSCAKVSDTVP